MADERPGGPPPSPAIGAVPLPPGYVLVEKLGSGGFATVWLAEQGRLGRRVAVKLLGETLEDSERERRFIAECRAIGRLSGHPAVVTVHDAGTTDAGHPYLVMEHLPGGSLHDRLHRSGPLPWTEVLDVGVHVADALAAAHDAGILHRDIKPANVLLDENGSPKLGDFGIARLSEGTNTATGTLVGTIPFTPPEVLSGHRPGPTADVWALGATLHTLLAGTSPFGGHRDEPPAATIARVLRSEPPPLPPSVPTSLRTLITDTLQPEPRDRPAEAVDVVARLQAIQAERGLPVTPARSTRTTTPTSPIGGTDATIAGVPAIPTGTPPPPPPGPGTPPPTPTSTITPAPPPPRTATGAIPVAHDPADDADAPTVARSASPDLAKAPAADPPTVVGSPGTPIDHPTDPAPGAAPGAPPGVVGATSVLPAYQPPDAASPAPPPPAPPKGNGRGERKAKAPVLAAVAILVVVLLAAGVGAALVLGGGDEEAGDDGPGTTAGEDADTDTTVTTPLAPDTDPTAVDSPLGTPLRVPTGLATAPAPEATWDLAADCGGDGSCSLVATDGAVVMVRSTGETTATVAMVAADGTEGWTYDVDGLSGKAGLALLGDLVIVSSTIEPTRTYRAISEGDLRWTVEVPQADGPVFQNPQASDAYAVMLLGNVGEYVVIDLGSGGTRREPGRVLATDEENVYVATGDTVVARSLATGDQVWQAEGVVSAAPPEGVFPSWRYGVVVDGTFVTATADALAFVDVATGEVTRTVPLTSETIDLGRPYAVAAVGSTIVVAAEKGDMGIDAATQQVRWRIERPRLFFTAEYDADTIRDTAGTPVWIGEAGRLVAGWAGDALQVIDLVDGEIVGSVELDPTDGRSSIAVFEGGVALLQAGRVTAYSLADLSVLWETDAYPEATSLAAVDGGLVVLDPAGLHGLRAAA